MPTYEYECDACEHRFEDFQSMSAAPLKKCPACKKNKLRRLIGAGAALIFKGSGFYLTDYRSDNYKKAAKADKDSSSTSAGCTGACKPESKSSDSKGSCAKTGE